MATGIVLACVALCVIFIVMFANRCGCGCGGACTCDGAHCQVCAGCSICKDKPRPGCGCGTCGKK